jgi:hypothetical protein
MQSAKHYPHDYRRLYHRAMRDDRETIGEALVAACAWLACMAIFGLLICMLATAG